VAHTYNPSSLGESWFETSCNEVWKTPSQTIAGYSVTCLSSQATQEARIRKITTLPSPSKKVAIFHPIQKSCMWQSFQLWWEAYKRRIKMAQQLRERIDKWDYMKLKLSAQQKKWSPDWRGSPQNGRKSFPVIHLTRDLTIIYRELTIINFQRINSLLNKWASELNRTSSKR
jgi:hypothetical protein